MKTVLVVDDERALLEAFEQGLPALLGEARIVTASDGREAIELLDSLPVDLVLTDLRMPVVDGFGVLAHLKDHHPRIPVIVMTGMVYAGNRERMAALGPVGYVEKPIDFRLMAKRIRAKLLPAVRGTVEGITLPGFLQLLRLEGKTCSLRLSSRGRNGLIRFEAGDLVHAASSRGRGETAFYDILDWDDVQISIEPPVSVAEATVTKPLEWLLLEAARRKDDTSDRGIEPLTDDLDEGGADEDRAEAGVSPDPGRLLGF